MPQAIDIVIKNGAAVDKTFSLLNPAGPSGTAALWALKEGTIKTVFPTIEASSRRNAARNAQKGQFTLKVPSSYTETATGLTVVASAVTFNLSVTVPDNFPEIRKDDVVAFWKNLNANPLFVSMVRDAISAT